MRNDLLTGKLEGAPNRLYTITMNIIITIGIPTPKNFFDPRESILHR
jgi:hypothetical protein